MRSFCENCRWYLGNHECAAFAEKIPKDVWEGQHKTELDGQMTGFIYEKVGDII